LHAFVGTTAFGLDNLVSAPSRLLVGGLTAALPLFDAGRIDARTRMANAETQAAIARYHDTLLNAIRETADALTRVTQREAELAQADASVREHRLLLDDATRRRTAGVGDDRAVRLNRIALLISIARAEDLRLAVAAARVTVVLATGGSADDPSILQTADSRKPT
jgi:multidrug efflux system outer membrane protein